MRWGSKQVPVAELVIPPGDWYYTREYETAAVAHHWHKAPSEFGALGEDDKAIMTAYWRVEQRMRAWEAEQDRKRLESQPKPAKGRR